jgi:Transglycosylase SLT domain
MPRTVFIRSVFGVWLAALLLAPPCPAQDLGKQGDGMTPDEASASALCTEAVREAERNHALPHGLLLAISQVESGRFDAATHRVEPWPWTVWAEDTGRYFASKAQAVRWVRDALARGVTSIDTGCLQVNLQFHPAAFATLDDAFDPGRNADYAARFLLRLHDASGDWRQATGAYHSQARALAAPYEMRVAQALGGLPWPGPPKPPTIAGELATAWQATLIQQEGGQQEGEAPQQGANDWSVLLRASLRPPARKLQSGGGN